MSLLDTIKKKIQPKKPAESEARMGRQSESAGKKRDREAVSEAARQDETVGRAPAKKAEPQRPQREHGGVSAQHKKHALDMLLRPYVTEKAAGLKAAGNKYVFIVADFANKRELRKVIQEKFKVAVTKVNIINIPRKSIRVGKTLGSKPGFKKAIITLKEGNTIETGV